METFPESTSQGLPPDGNPGPFPSFRNVGAPYMETLSLLGLTIGLPIWLFSRSVVPSVMTLVLPSPSFESRQDDPRVESSPSSPISSSSSPTSPGESSTSSNQEAKKKTMKTKKKNLNKREATRATIALHASRVGKPSDPLQKVPSKLCKCYHFLHDFPGIPRS